MKSLLTSYRNMLTIRFFELEIEKLFSKGMVQGTTHCSTGQEAVAVGVCRVLKKRDYITSTHRGHGHFLACGGDPRKMMAELFGKSTGYSRGRGGSQFMADFRLGYLGANGITGGSIPVATGAALSAKLNKEDRVTVCFLGDGASNQGTFHESLNMASIWQLPIVYVCENNMFGMSTHMSESMSVEHVAQRAASYDMATDIVEGNDIEAVTNATEEAIAHAKKEGPYLLECKTYRHCGHSRGDPQVYKCPDEEKLWLDRDPIKSCYQLLKSRGQLDGKANTALRKEVKNVIKEAVRFAKTSPYPDPASLEKGLFV
jgi:TPP-dependent pyruvate/acetoin dehydrogenase alpha subunit